MGKKKSRHQKKTSQDISNDDIENLDEQVAEKVQDLEKVDEQVVEEQPAKEESESIGEDNNEISVESLEQPVKEEDKTIQKVDEPVEKVDEPVEKVDEPVEKVDEPNSSDSSNNNNENDNSNNKKENNNWDEDEIEVPNIDGINNDIPAEEKKYIIKQKKVIKVKKEKKEKPPVVKKEPEPVQQQQQQQQQSSGWGGWFSSIGNAVSNTITQIARVDLEDSDEESEEEIVVEEDVELTKEEYEKYMERKRDQEQEFDDEGNTILNAIDNGVFKTADMIADSLFFAGNLLSSGFKSVQDNANMENVNAISQEVSNMSLETKNKISNSEIYGKSQKIASQVMDSSVDVLESVGQRAYSMFSTQLKLNKANSNNNKSDIPQDQSSSVDNSNNNNNNNNNNNSNNNNTSPEKRFKTPSKSSQTENTSNSTTTTVTINETPVKNQKQTQQQDSSDNDEDDEIIDFTKSIFEAGEFDSSVCAEHYNITKFTQDIEKISVESTMKVHQINRKVISNSSVKSQVEQVLNEIKELFESEDIVPSSSETNNKLSFSNIHVYQLEKKYNKFFDSLQEYIPTLKSQSIELGLCRGLELIYQLTSIGLELISTIAESIPDERPSEPRSSSDDIKEWSLEKSNQILFLITKSLQDIKLISSMLTEIIKSKQSPNSRKLLNTLHVETTNASSYIQDTKGGLANIFQIMYLNQIKNLIKGSSSPNTPIRK